MAKKTTRDYLWVTALKLGREEGSFSFDQLRESCAVEASETTVREFLRTLEAFDVLEGTGTTRQGRIYNLSLDFEQLKLSALRD